VESVTKLDTILSDLAADAGRTRFGMKHIWRIALPMLLLTTSA